MPARWRRIAQAGRQHVERASSMIWPSAVSIIVTTDTNGKAGHGNPGRGRARRRQTRPTPRRGPLPVRALIMPAASSAARWAESGRKAAASSEFSAHLPKKSLHPCQAGIGGQSPPRCLGAAPACHFATREPPPARVATSRPVPGLYRPFVSQGDLQRTVTVHGVDGCTPRGQAHFSAAACHDAAPSSRRKMSQTPPVHRYRIRNRSHPG